MYLAQEDGEPHKDEKALAVLINEDTQQQNAKRTDRFSPAGHSHHSRRHVRPHACRLSLPLPVPLNAAAKTNRSPCASSRPAATRPFPRRLPTLQAIQVSWQVRRTATP